MHKMAYGRDYSFRWYLAALIAVLTIPLLALAVFPTLSYVTSERARLRSAVRETAEDILEALDRDLAAKIAILRALATSPALDVGDFDRFDRQARELFKDGLSVALRGPAGQQYVNTTYPSGTSLPDISLPLDSAIAATRRPVISGLYIGPATRKHVVTIAVPVVRDGVLRYVLGARLPPAYFAEFLTRQNLRPSGYGVIADHNGIMIAASQQSEERTGKPITGYADMTGVDGTWSGRSNLNVVVFRTYRRSALTGWMITASVELAALDAPLHRSLWLLLASSFALTATALGASLFLSRRMAAAFAALSSASQEMGEGKVVVFSRSPLREANEIGRRMEDASSKLLDNAMALSWANDDLARRVDARTREAEQAQATAEAANQAKSQFLASMSHELRTPLNAISGFAQLLNQTGDTLMRDRQIRYTQNIMDGSDQLKSIVDDVLDMAGIEIGRVNLTCDVLDSMEVLSEAYRAMEGLAKQRGIMFTADTSVTLPPVMADRGRLIQILTNLLSNAIKYNTQGGWVMLAGTPRDGMVRFSVRDTGRGVPAEHHDRIFEAFNRCGAENSQEAGTGLGLAISRKLVEAMQGEIGFESAVGAGSKFWIDLPVATEVVATKPQPPATPQASPGEVRYKILYIEDRLPNVELMRAIIEEVDGAQLFDAQTVQDGMTCIAAHRPDLVITDIHLPDGTGFDVLQRLRANPDTRHIPVIALTADAMPTNIHNMQRHSFDYILTKPFKIPELTDIVRITRQAA